jgi:AraC-like DNA-binding protein
VKIQSVAFNNRRRDFTVRLGASVYRYPYLRLETLPAPGDRVVAAKVDPDIGREGFSYVLASGAEGTVHGDQVLDYNRDPRYLREALLYELTLAAQQRLRTLPLSQRELARRLGTSPAQLHRLLDQTNTRKSVDRMLALLAVLECEVDMRIRPARAAAQRDRPVLRRTVAGRTPPVPRV